MNQPFFAGAIIVGGFFILARNFLKEVPAQERIFVSRCIFFAFLLYSALFILVYGFYLKGDQFLYGDGEGYHEAAMSALDYFASGQFKITRDMVSLNNTGYSSYFVAPIYIFGGPERTLPIMVHLVLCLHVAIMIYRMTVICTGGYAHARYAFFFSLFFFSAITIALYFLKDVLLLWLIGVALYSTTLIREKGFSLKRILILILTCSYMVTIRPEYALAVVIVCLYTLVQFTKRSAPYKKFFYFMLSTIIVIMIWRWALNRWDGFSVDNIEKNIQEGYLVSSLSEKASYGTNLILLIHEKPWQSMVYLFKTFLHVFSGGLAGFREFFGMYRPEPDKLDIGWIGGQVDAIWRFINFPITFIGLWVILRKYSHRFLPCIVFTIVLIVIIFVHGISTRYALPGMILNSISWGVGFSTVLSKRKKANDPTYHSSV